MLCRRCGGLMTVEPFEDATEQTTPGEMMGMRCINCGNIEDAVIYANRIEGSSRRPTRDDITAEVEVDCCWH